MAKEGFVNLNGVKLHYLDWGGTGKPLVLLTGVGATSKYYGGLAPKLTKRFKVFGLTRRGHGQSDRSLECNLDVLVEDIRHFLDAMSIERAILVGHSMAGFEMPLFAERYPQRVEAIVFMDAIYPKMDSEPDFSDDPTNALPAVKPTAEDFASLDAYFAYRRKARPAWARIWCKAIEDDILEYVKISPDGRIEETMDDELFSRIWKEVSSQYPKYQKVNCPMLAIMPMGQYHPDVTLDASDDIQKIADKYWQERVLPFIQETIKSFCQTAPKARVVELDTPNHRAFMAKEDETVEAIFDFLSTT